MSKRKRNFHLILSQQIFQDLLPTGCRASKEAEASWRLGAAIDVAREFQSRGRLPLLAPSITNKEERSQSIHVTLADVDVEFLNIVSKQEDCSRGQLARMLLVTASQAVQGVQGCLNHSGLMEEIKKLFL